MSVSVSAISPCHDQNGSVVCLPDFDPIPDAGCQVLLGNFLVWLSDDILRLGSFPISLGAKPPRHGLFPRHPAIIVDGCWFLGGITSFTNWEFFVSVFESNRMYIFFNNKKCCARSFRSSTRFTRNVCFKMHNFGKIFDGNQIWSLFY